MHGGIINIYGGKIRAVGGDGGAGIGGGGSCDDAGQVVTIYGGEIEALCMYDGAGIGGGTRSDMGTVIINGGEIKATGGEKSAGIGGGSNGKDGKGQIIINDGKVEANGGKEGPGIGAGHDSYIESITISGGTVYAYPGSTNESTTDNYPAAIGGCASEAFKETITISGGYIWAETETMAAAIGSGYRRDFAGQIIITGGNVNANAGTDPICEYAGAGIGSGANGKFTSEGLVKITGGQVNAFSYAQVNAGAGIGSGGLANMEGTVQITGGYVEAGSFLQNPEQYVVGGKAGTGAGIGSGCESQSTGGGGEFKGKIYIDGGEVLAYTDDPDARAIGAGHEGDTNGEIRLYSTARVYAGIYEDNHPYYSRIYLIDYDQRVSSFSNMCVFIEQCEHEEKTYTVQDPAEAGHNWRCTYCNATGTEAHSLDNDNHCAACGYQGLVPVFKTQNLILSGEIGLSFNMELPDINGVDYTTSYMTFTIPHGTVTERVDYADSAAKTSGNQAFICYVNSIQMAEPVTATFHYQMGNVWKTVQKTYAVADYFSAFDENINQFDETTRVLVKAVADYGHYVQPFLSESRGWVLGTDYLTLDKHYASSYDFSSIVAPSIQSSNESQGDIDDITYSLTLDSDTVINMYFRLDENYSGSFELTEHTEDEDVEFECAKRNDGRYWVRIKGIAAHKLSKIYYIKVTTEHGTATLTLSALSYVNSALANYNDTNDPDLTARNAVAAIYAYSQAADAYKAAH